MDMPQLKLNTLKYKFVFQIIYDVIIYWEGDGKDGVQIQSKQIYIHVTYILASP